MARSRSAVPVGGDPRAAQQDNYKEAVGRGEPVSIPQQGTEDRPYGGYQTQKVLTLMCQS